MRTIINLAKLVASALIFVCGALSAQEIPALKRASEVTVGKLPNGIQYYLVTGKAAKGEADMAIVQPGGIPEPQVRDALVELPHFDGKKPYLFLARHGVGYKRFGYAESSEAATIYRFEGVPVSSQAVCDTALMMLFGISERCPDGQAIIISGDINPSAVKERMGVLSMMVSPRGSKPVSPRYVPTLCDTLRLVQEASDGRQVAGITVSIASPRASRDMLGTVQPLVTDMFSRCLGNIVRNRISSTFRTRDIPLSGVSFSYRSSADGPSDEEYSLTVHVPPTRVKDATQALAEILSDLDAHGAALGEYAHAREQLISNYNKLASSRPQTNAQWVDKCIASYLYGATPITEATRAEFFSDRRLSAADELPLFNGFVSALLDVSRGMTLRYRTPQAGGSELATLWRVAWNMSNVAPSVSEYVLNYGDTLSLASPKKGKVKLKNAVPDPISGGQLWTFSNGMRVVYKKADTKGRFDYALLIKGGYSEVKGLSYGEGGFVGDMLGLCDVAGLSGAAFGNMLASNGISMDANVGLSDMRLVGSAPSDKLSLVLRSMLSLAGDRALNRDAFAYYRKCEALRLSLVQKQQEGITAVLDSIMCPGYALSPHKHVEGLGEDLPERAEAYFEDCFSRADDGVLVLVGDLDADAAKKHLTRLMGGFRTSGRHASRPQVQYRMRPGWSTYAIGADDAEVGSGEQSINVAMSVMAPYTGERYAAWQIAMMVIRNEVVSAMAEYGMSVEMTGGYELFPAERVTMSLTCRPADPSGLPSGMAPEDPLIALGRVRSALSKVSSGRLTDAQLKLYKAAFLESVTAEMSHPDYMERAVLTRYSFGKDITTGYKEKINSVTVQSVKDMLKSFEDGSKVEFIIY